MHMRSSHGAVIKKAASLLAFFGLLFFAYFAFSLPSVTFVPPTLADYSVTGVGWVFVNATSSEPLNQSLLEWGNSSGYFNLSMLNSSQTNWYLNVTGLSDGYYNYTIWAQNLSDFWNQSVLRSVDVDTASPSAPSLASPPNDTDSSDSAPFLDWFGAADLNFLNYTILVGGSPSLSSPDYLYNTTESNYSVVSPWADGAWFWVVVAYDRAGNSNSSGVFSYNLDASPPNITLLFPDNNSVVRSGTWLNFSIADSANSVDAAWWSNDSGVTNYSFADPWDINTTGWSAGLKAVDVSANDSLGNVKHDVFRFTIDDTPPSVSFVGPTPVENASTGRAWAYLNVTVSDSSNTTAFFDWERSLVGWWRFNQESGETPSFFRDWSSYGNNASCSGSSCPAPASGKFGSALYFDGVDDYVNVGSGSSLNFTNYTIIGWVRPVNNGTSSRHIVYRGAEAGNRGYLIQLSGSDNLYFYQSAGGDFYALSQSYSLPHDGKFHQFSMAFVYNGSSTLTVYIDDAFKGVRTNALIGPDFPLPADNLTFGSPAGIFNGTIDELRIWNRALSPEEINASFNAGAFRLYRNFTNLADGTYTYSAYAQDSAGNLGQSSRTLLVETSTPSVAFTPPTDDDSSFVPRDYSFVNVSVSDPSNATAFIDWNRSLVAWWRFNQEGGENSSFFRDWSSWANNASCSGSVCPNATAGRFGDALRFDGVNDYLNAGNRAALNVTGNRMAVEAWIYYTGGDIPINQRVTVVSKYNASNSFILDLPDDGGVEGYRFFADAASAKWNATPAANTWTHLVGVYNATNLLLYVNGIERANIAKAGNISPSNVALSVGSRLDGAPAYFFNGSIDELRIWNRVLSPEEINASYNAGSFRLYRNFTGLAEGTYPYTAYAQDSAGNVNVTSRVVGVDLSAPALFNVQFSPFVDVDRGEAVVRANVSDFSGAEAVLIEHNSTGAPANYTMFLESGTNRSGAYNRTIAFSDLATISFRIFANDSFGRSNGTPNYSISARNITASITLNSTSASPSDPIRVTGQAFMQPGGSELANNSISLWLGGSALGLLPATDSLSLEGWLYYKTITVNGSRQGNLSDYPVAVNVTYGQNMQPGFGDIRFAWYNQSSQSQVAVPYWVEAKLNGSWAYAWVKIPEIPANSTSTLYLYYGNPHAVDAGNGSAVFDFFEDFTDGDYATSPSWTNVNDWGTGFLDASSGVLRIYQTSNSGNSAWTTSTTARGEWRLNFRLSNLGGCSNTRVVWYFIRNSTAYYYVEVRQDTNVIRFGNQAGVLTSVGFTPSGDWYALKITRDYAGQFNVSINNVPRLSFTDNNMTNSTNMSISGHRDCGSADVYVDNISVRKYSSPEPSVLSIGAELPAVSTNSSGGYSYFFSAPLEAGNHTVKINITDSAGIYGENSASFVQQKIAVREQKALGVFTGTSRILPGYELNISARVYRSLDGNISAAWVNVTSPNGTDYTYPLAGAGNTNETGFWFRVLNVSSEFGDALGDYVVGFYANETGGLVSEAPAPQANFAVQNISITEFLGAYVLNPYQSFSVWGETPAANATVYVILNTTYRTGNVSYFNDSSTSKNITFGSAGAVTAYIRLYKYLDVVSARFDVRGLFYNNSFPRNPSIDIGNNNDDDFWGAGTYTGTLFTQDRFSDNFPSRNISFYMPDYDLSNVTLPKSLSLINATLNISGKSGSGFLDNESYNMIQNGGFENGTNWWTFYSSHRDTNATGIVKEGNYSAHFTSTLGSYSAFWYPQASFKSSVNNKKKFYTMWYYPLDLTADYINLPSFTLSQTSGPDVCIFRPRNTTAFIYSYGGSYLYFSNPMKSSRWYKIQLYCNPSVSEAILWVDGVRIARATGTPYTESYVGIWLADPWVGNLGWGNAYMDGVYLNLDPVLFAPENVTLNVGNDNDTEWSQPGVLNASNSPQSAGVSPEVSSYLDSCTASTDSRGNRYCNVPVNVTSAAAGNVSLTALNFSYNYSSAQLSSIYEDFRTAVNNYLSTCSDDESGYCNVPLVFRSDSAGIIEVSNINLTFVADYLNKTTTDSSGNYSLAVTAPKMPGGYDVSVFLFKYGDLFGSESENITVLANATLSLVSTPTPVDVDVGLLLWADYRKLWGDLGDVNYTYSSLNLSIWNSTGGLVLNNASMVYNSTSGRWEYFYNLLAMGVLNYTAYANSWEVVNGQPVVNQTVSSSFEVQNVSIFAATPKSVYVPEENLTVSGTVLLQPYGSAVVNNTISLYLDGLKLFFSPATGFVSAGGNESLRTDAAGNFNYTLKSPLEAGNHTILINMTNPNGIFGQSFFHFVSSSIAVRNQTAVSPQTLTAHANQNEDMRISAFVYRNFDNPISAVWMNVSLPNSSVRAYALENGTSPYNTGAWSKTLNVSFEFGNLLGRYNVTFYANSTLYNGSAVTQELPAPSYSFYVENMSLSERLDRSFVKPEESLDVSGYAVLMPDYLPITNNPVVIGVGNGTLAVNGTGGLMRSEVPWSAQNMRYRFKLSLNETKGLNRTGEPVAINGSWFAQRGVNLSRWVIASTRVFFNGSEVPSQVDAWKDDSKRSINSSQVYFGDFSELVFVVNITGGGRKDFWVYFDDNYSTAPAYATDLTVDGSIVGNGFYTFDFWDGYPWVVDGMNYTSSSDEWNYFKWYRASGLGSNSIQNYAVYARGPVHVVIHHGDWEDDGPVYDIWSGSRLLKKRMVSDSSSDYDVFLYRDQDHFAGFNRGRMYNYSELVNSYSLYTTIYDFEKGYSWAAYYSSNRTRISIFNRSITTGVRIEANSTYWSTYGYQVEVFEDYPGDRTYWMVYDFFTNVNAAAGNWTSRVANPLMASVSDFQSVPATNSTGGYLVQFTAPDSDGAYAIVVNVTDGNGIRGSSLLALTVDGVPPSISVISPSNASYLTDQIPLNYSVFDSSGVSYCIYELNGINTSLPSCQNATVTASEGANLILVWANDSAGNWNGSAPVSFVVDTTAPAIAVQSPAGGTYSAANMTLNYTVWDFWGVSSCAYELTNSSGAYNVSLSGCLNTTFIAAEGNNSVRVWANDSVGNWNSSALVSFAVDTLVPGVGVHSPSNVSYATGSIALNFTAWDAGGVDSCWYELTNSSGVSNVSLPNCLNATLAGLAEGSNGVRVWVNDTANNWNVSSSVSFTVDTLGPSINIQKPISAVYATTEVGLNYTVWDAGGVSSCAYELTNSSGSYNFTLPDCTNATLAGLAEGSNGVRVWANDSVGNWNSSALVLFTVDTLPPALSFVFPTPYGQMIDVSYVFVNVSSSEPLSSALLEWNGTNFTMLGSGSGRYLNLTSLARGNFSFRVFANDSAGNWNYSGSEWVLVNYTPVVKINFKLVNSSGGTVENASLVLYNSSGAFASVAFGYANSSFALNFSGGELGAKFSAPSGEVLRLTGISAGADADIRPQFVPYSGFLPENVLARSGAVALNDSGFSFALAEVGIPLSGSADRILHCLNWSFSSASCSSWESKPSSDYNASGNSTWISFNVTFFDAYLAGYYSAPPPPPSGGPAGGPGGGAPAVASPSKSRGLRIQPGGPLVFVEVNFREALAGASLKISGLSKVPVLPPAGPVYYYFNASAVNFNKSDIKSATVEFRVNKSWIAGNDIASVYLAVYDGGWVGVGTVQVNSSQTQDVYRAYPPAFSYFAIAGVRAGAPPPPTPPAVTVLENATVPASSNGTAALPDEASLTREDIDAAIMALNSIVPKTERARVVIQQARLMLTEAQVSFDKNETLAAKKSLDASSALMREAAGMTSAAVTDKPEAMTGFLGLLAVLLGAYAYSLRRIKF